MAHPARALPLALLLLCSAGARAATLTTTWLGGNGSWNEPARWSGAVVPNNTGSDSFDAAIDGGNTLKSEVTLDAADTIGSLQVDAGDSLMLTPTGQLTLDGGRIDNAGEIVLQGSGTGSAQSLVLNSYPSSTVLSGGGSVRLDGGGIFEGPLVNMDNHIAGWGGIALYPSGGFANYGLVEADVAGKDLAISQGYANYGTMRAVAGGTLFFDHSGYADTNFGTIEALDGSHVHQADANNSIGGRFIALRDSTMSLSGYYEGTEFVTDSDSLITIGGSESGVRNVTLDGNFQLVNTQASGTITNRGNIQLAGFSLSATEPTTFINQGHMVLYAADVGELSLAGAGTVTLASAYVSAQLRNLDNQIRGTGNIRKLTQNAGLIEAADGVLSVENAGVPTTDHTGLFAAAPGGVLEMEAAVTGTGAWRADGGLIHVTGDVETTGNIEVLHGGSLVVETQMTGGDLTVDATSALDVNGVLRIAGNLDFDGPQSARWSFATGAFFETSGGVGAAVGDWEDWQSLEAAGRDLGLIAAGFSSANFYLPRLIIGPDGHLFLKDGRDNGNRVLDESEALYVDTLVFSDSLSQLNLNGIRLYYNHLVGTTSQIIDVPVPEPALSALVTAVALLAAARSLRRKERSLAQS